MTRSNPVHINGTCIQDCGLKAGYNETYMTIGDKSPTSSSPTHFNETEMIFKMVLCVLLMIVALSLCFFWDKNNSNQSGYNPDDTDDDDGGE